MTHQLTNAHAFFTAPFDRKAHGLAAAAPGASDSDGLVAWVGTANGIPGGWQSQQDQTYKDLSALLSIANAYYNKQSPNNKFNFDLWDQIYQHFPLFSASKATDETFHQNIKGVEIAVKFLSMMLDAIVLPSAAVTEFGKFLNGIGDQIKLGTNTSGRNYTCVWNNMTYEFVDIGGGHFEYVPKLKLYYVNFTQQNRTISTSCGSYQSYDFNLTYKQRVQLFNYQSVPPGSDLRAKFDQFLSGQQQQQIDDSSNFFSGSFEGSPVKGLNVERLIAGYRMDEDTIKSYKLGIDERNQDKVKHHA